MSALTVTLGADISALKQSMASATQLVSASAKKMASLSAAGLKIGLGAALAGGGVALAAGIKAVTSAADFEQTKVAFTTLIGDAGKAEQTLAQLRELGAKTPFEFPELADAGRKLIAFGEGSDTVAATLARIGDVSAGVQAPVNEIAELYGKARVQGRLFAEDINQLTGRGIPIIGELAKQFGVSDSEVKKLVESGQVGFPQIEQAFVNMTSQGGKFSGMMEAQSKTTNGLFSTLKDTINEVFLTLGTPINDAIRPLVEQAIALVQKLAPLATEAGAKIRDAIQYVIAVFRSGEFLNLVGTALKLGFALSVNFLWASLRGTIAAAGQYIVEVFRTAITYFKVLTTADFWKGMGNVLIGIFLSAIGFLQKGLAEAMEIARPLAELFGQSGAIDSAQGALRESAGMLDAEAANRFGTAGDQLGPLAEKVGQRLKEAGENISNSSGDAFSNTADVIDTTGMKQSMDTVLGSIRDALPKPEAAKKVADAAAAVKPTGPSPNKPTSETFAPIVTSLGKVGGGGYSSGTLDAQRENNKLTSETNRILRDMSERMKPGTGNLIPVFG
ncbi:MAG: tape measure protein [Akkermansiaceae bacterium]|nr:tape measure protein [Akkermansiaceae bacterium]